MTSQEFWVLAHLVLFAYWLGADLGQFYLSFHVRRAELAPSTRLLVAKAMVALDQFPRMALVLMLPVGFTLARTWGSDVTGGRLVALWVACGAWLGAVLFLHFRDGSDAAEVLRRFDWGLRAVLAPSLIVLGVVSLVNDDPFPVDFVAWKLVIFGTIIGLGLGIRLAIRPFGPALGGIAAGGSTPELEAQLQASLRPAYPMVVAIWVLLLSAAALGVAKPL